MALLAELNSATTHTKRGYFLARLLLGFSGSSSSSAAFLLEAAFALPFGLALPAFAFASALSPAFVGILGAEYMNSTETLWQAAHSLDKTIEIRQDT